MYATLIWLSDRVMIAKRPFLFSFNGKTMTGMIEELKESELSNNYIIKVGFIEPDYFKDDIIVGGTFTINEASIILGKGQITAQ